MAAFTGLVPLPQNQWTALNASEVDEILVQNRNWANVEVLATAVNSAPDVSAEGILYPFSMGEDMTLASIFKGVSAPKYLWAISRTGKGSVWVSHA